MILARERLHDGPWHRESWDARRGLFRIPATLRKIGLRRKKQAITYVGQTFLSVSLEFLESSNVGGFKARGRDRTECRSDCDSSRRPDLPRTAVPARAPLTPFPLLC